MAVSRNQPAPCHGHHTPSRRQARYVRTKARIPPSSKIVGVPSPSRVRCGVPQATVSAVDPPQVLTHTAATTKNTTAARATPTLKRMASRTPSRTSASSWRKSLGVRYTAKNSPGGAGVNLTNRHLEGRRLVVAGAGDTPESYPTTRRRPAHLPSPRESDQVEAVSSRRHSRGRGGLPAWRERTVERGDRGRRTDRAGRRASFPAGHRHRRIHPGRPRDDRGQGDVGDGVRRPHRSGSRGPAACP